MKILFDHQIFDFQQFGGVSRYFYELIAHFERDHTIEWELPLTYSDNEYLKGLPSLKNKISPRSEKINQYDTFLWGGSFRGKRILYRLKNKLVAPKPSKDETVINKSKSIAKLKEGNFDIFHPTYYDDYFLEYINDKPFVLTVYDLIHQIFPEFGLYEKTDKNKELLQRASKIIAISESTKVDLVNIFNVNPEKISVTHLAASLQEESSGVSKDFASKIPSKYLLYVGGRGGYKNFLFFIHIFGALVSSDKDLFVVCTGSRFNGDELYLFDKIGIADHVYHTYVNDNELAYLYRKAVAFIFPSMYEGFGLPILEAFSCGCPVLVSNTSSLSEIGQDAAIYFEPKNPASMISAIKEVLHKDAFRMEHINKGYKQLKKFSWQKTADETISIYQEVIYGSNRD